MEDAFQKLQNDGKNSFKEVLNKLASETQKSVSDFITTLTEQGPKLMNAAMAAATVFKDALDKK
ncbi:unnamed protein product [Leptidea sinapis]|uniref:Uncharacterized protein n=1 Tax=Leptidea sinapis TaxID=189913 RepID=A0A5E4R339_9NEOP|nr:unnamed protein product [Leptidea sinapis]